jgi:hypothetical protein
VRVAALVGGDDHAAVLRQPFHTLLHTAVGVGAPVVAPAVTHTAHTREAKSVKKKSPTISSILRIK